MPSWIDKELKRRAAGAAEAAPSAPAAPGDNEPARIRHLWTKFERLNAALPAELQLRAEDTDATRFSPEHPGVTRWLRAHNGAALGLAPEALRYTWPQRRARRSNNFWIRWDARERRYLVSQRVGSSSPPQMRQYPLDPKAVDTMIQRLVQGRQVTVRSVRKKTFWLF